MRGDHTTGRWERSRRFPAAILLVLSLTGCGSPDVVEAAPAGPVAAPLPGTTIAAATVTVVTTTAPAGPHFVSQGADPTPEQLAEHGFGTTTTMAPTYFAPIVIRLEPRPGTLALTFDDGPDPKWTPIILDILKEHGVTATFFVLGWKVDAYPGLARRIVDEGHSLQSHAYRHHNLTNRSDAAVGALIDGAAEAIFNATGTTPVCLRPPAGITNGRLMANAAARVHQVILWTPQGSSLDYSLQSSSAVLARARHWQAGDITLMHDTWGAIYEKALKAMLDDIDSRGIGYSTICVAEKQR